MMNFLLNNVEKLMVINISHFSPIAVLTINLPIGSSIIDSKKNPSHDSSIPIRFNSLNKAFVHIDRSDIIDKGNNKLHNCFLTLYFSEWQERGLCSLHINLNIGIFLCHTFSDNLFIQFICVFLKILIEFVQNCMRGQWII